MKRLNYLIASLILIMCLFIFVACGGETDNPDLGNDNITVDVVDEIDEDIKMDDVVIDTLGEELEQNDANTQDVIDNFSQTSESSPEPTPIPEKQPEPEPVPLPPAPEPEAEPVPVPPAPEPAPQPAPSVSNEQLVWIPQSGTKYHSKAGCSNMENPYQKPLSWALQNGYDACKRCH